MRPEDLLDDDELEQVLNTDTSMIVPSDENTKKEFTIDNFPHCETCGNYDYIDDAKGNCRNVEHSRMMWIEDLSYPPLTVTRYFGCIEHTKLRKEK